jgi:antitoxin ParD1/3/4
MAVKNTSIALGKPFIDFAKRKVESGEFATTSEVVREAMRRYIEIDRRREALDKALQEGRDSGPAQPFKFEDFIAEMHAKHKDAA